jgi:predicted enzyme related to lactoylglutathione lyase
MNLQNAKIAQILIPVEDFNRGMAFYGDILGIPFLFSAPPQMAFFNCGGVRLLVGVLPAGQTAQRGSAIYFRSPILMKFVLLSKAREFASKQNLTLSIGRLQANSG